MFSFIAEVSYNQPKFSSCATWNPDANTFLDNNTFRYPPYDIFVDTNNTIFVADPTSQRVQIWLEGSTIPTRNISTVQFSPYSLFATPNADIYIANGFSTYYYISKWTLNATSSDIVMYVDDICCSQFVDISNNLYCSLCNRHKVVKKSFYDDANTTKVIAGNGSSGAAPNMLNFPLGIFVALNFNLYVADCSNNRVQLFQPDHLNATTIPMNGTLGTISLSCPSAVMLDADGYLFILDLSNNRIIGSDYNGFRCIAGCTNSSGSASNQLHSPWSFGFDTYGNIFVSDQDNFRIQKFLLNNNSCGKFYFSRNHQTF